MTEAQKKQYYHLVAGEIIFRDPSSEEGVGGTSRLNVMLITEDGNVRHKEIGKVQQMLQMHFFKRIGDEQLQVLDVVIINISLLGFMTAEEFNTPPEGMVLQEAPQDIVPASLQ